MSDGPRPWFRSGRGWFVQIGKKQHSLGIADPNDLAGAMAAFHDLLARLGGSVGVVDVKPVRRVAEAVAAFLERQKARVSPECWRQYRIALEVHLVPAFGSRDVATLTADEIEEWARRPGWSSSTRHGRLGAVGTFLKWAGHPVKLHRPPKESRGADTVLSDEQFDRVLAAYDPKYGGDLRAFLRVLRLCGARPGEIAGLEVAGVDWSNGCARLRQHKTASKGKQRVVYFNSAALAVLEGQRAKYGAGFLFRTRNGRPYSGKQIKEQMERISKRVGFRAIAYGERHGFATRALCAGIPDAVVSELLGHSSPAMVAKNYGHLAQQSRVLREAAEKLAG